ncbi:uncharacterized protein [Penaeus vannamei]|uniref:uncharacterized protein n=1 Tax=Penaeus vannamei TaxID=6689 RepID=UPI00387F9514
MVEPSQNASFDISAVAHEIPAGSFAICKLHGILDCWLDPHPASGNMSLAWDQSNHLDAWANYTCHEGFHVSVNANRVTQNVQCRGQIGAWGLAPWDCAADGCFDDPPLPPAQVTMTLSVDYRSEDGVILYACPTDMATLDNVTIQNVTCTRRYPQFVFWPQTVQECLVCVAEPKVSNATTDWDETAVWYIGDNVTATCLDKYHLHGDVVSQTLACTATGWEEVEGCVLIPYCFDDPPPAPSPLITIATSVNFRNASGTVTFTCPDLMGMRDGRSDQVVTCSEMPTEYVFLPTSVEDCDVCLGEPTVENATTDWAAESLYLTGQAVTATCLQDHLTDGDAAGKNVSCTSVGWEAVGGCYLACVAPPPSAGENMVRGERKNSAVGSVIEYVCSPGFLLRQYGEPKNATTVVCGADATWQVADETLACAYPIWTLPEAPNGTVISVPGPPNWPNTTFDCTCEDGLWSATGVSGTTVTATLEGWMLQDPDFFCTNGICSLSFHYHS